MATTIPTQTDKCRGAMIATAIGDALGWPNEIRSKNKSKNVKSGEGFVKWIRYSTKPRCHYETILPGEYSDDTQLTLSVARSIIVGNWEQFFAEKELTFWLRYERGGGKALRNAAKVYKEGQVPWESKLAVSYFNAGGNGAVMRILPHVISRLRAQPFEALMTDIIKDSIITHGHPRAILGATCYAFALDYLLKKENVLSYGELVSALLEGQNIWGKYPDGNVFCDWLNIANKYLDYHKEWENTRSSMLSQLEFIKSSLKKGLILDDSSVLAQLGCFSKISGAGDVAILAAIYLASRYANNPVLGLKIPASSVGMDTDTIASITGGLLGMLCGTDWIPPEWTCVQDYECLTRIADMIVSENNKRNKKEPVNDFSDWIYTSIGRLRRLGTTEVECGKYATVIIQKWQSALGQTLYTKDLRQNLIQPINYNASEVLAPRDIELDQNITLRREAKHNTQEENAFKSIRLSEGKFVLEPATITSLLNNPNFKQNITIGKVLKIVHFLMEKNVTDADIAKKFEVTSEFVKLIKSCIQ